MALDGNGDNLLSAQELKGRLQKAGLKDIPADTHQVMKDIDSNGSGAIDYTKFRAATLDRRVYVQRHVYCPAFRDVDLLHAACCMPVERGQQLR